MPDMSFEVDRDVTSLAIDKIEAFFNDQRDNCLRFKIDGQMVDLEWEIESQIPLKAYVQFKGEIRRLDCSNFYKHWGPADFIARADDTATALASELSKTLERLKRFDSSLAALQAMRRQQEQNNRELAASSREPAPTKKP